MSTRTFHRQLKLQVKVSPQKSYYWMMKSLLLIIFLLLLPGVVMATEEPAYKVIIQNDDYEVREYKALIVAQVIVNEDFENAGNTGFRILAAYIFGGNQSKTKIAMTAPVGQVAQVQSEKIAMTAPVALFKNESGFAVQFTMPKNFTLETLPAPNDSRVKLIEIPPRKVAVYRYSGSWSESRYQEKLAQFREALKKNSVVTQGDPIFARFNSPFMIWFLRRNEIWINLSK